MGQILARPLLGEVTIYTRDVIDTQRLRLRPMRAEDGPAFDAMIDDPAIGVLIPDREPNYNGTEWVASVTANTANKACFTVEWRGRVIGLCLATSRFDGRIVLGYWIAPPFRGRGFAAETVSETLALLSRRDHPKQIMATCHRGNMASAKVLEKTGFVLADEHWGGVPEEVGDFLTYVYDPAD
ncbi:MAG: GNAT family N-acetyltransferase [Magnetospiraceae bacterium]